MCRITSSGVTPGITGKATRTDLAGMCEDERDVLKDRLLGCILVVFARRSARGRRRHSSARDATFESSTRASRSRNWSGPIVVTSKRRSPTSRR